MVSRKVLLFYVVLSSLLFLFSYGVEINQVNFNWDDVSVYGQVDLFSSSIQYYNSPQDFIVTNTSLIILNTGNDKIIEVLLNQSLSRSSYTNSPADQLWAITDTKLSGAVYYIAGSQRLYRIINKGTDQTSAYMSSGLLQGLAYDEGLLYISNHRCCRVAVFNTSDVQQDFIHPNIIYGQQNETYISQKRPGPTLSDSTRKIVVDPIRSLLWVADTQNRRIVGYPLVSNGSSYVPQIVLGQPNDSSLLTTLNANRLINPTAIAFNADYTVMFVADKYRVVRFRAPFSNGQAAEGMLGFSSFSSPFNQPYVNSTTGSTFNDIFALHFTDYNNGTGRLYILDRLNNRVVAGITSTAAPSTFPLYCNYEKPKSANCLVDGNVVVANQSLSLGASSQLIIEGNLTLGGSQTLVSMEEGQMIVCNGTVEFDGTLLYQIYSNITVDTSIPLFEHNGSRGEFSSIQIFNSQEEEGCRSEGRGDYRATSMSVLVTQVCSGGGSSVAADGGAKDGGGGGGDETLRNVVIVVVVGVVGFVVIVVVIGGIVAAVVAKKRKQQISNALGLAD